MPTLVIPLVPTDWPSGVAGAPCCKHVRCGECAARTKAWECRDRMEANTMAHLVATSHQKTEYATDNWHERSGGECTFR